MEPDTIVDQPVPLLAGGFTDPSGNAASQTDEMPERVPQRNVPRPIMAVETISESLDTATRKIKGEFTFEQLGAITIGLFKEGVSGEIAISPDGIVATNRDGETTFALDDETGDATFKGRVTAGSFVSGNSHGATVGPVANQDGADFDDIQEAIDYIHALNGGTVLVKTGTYVLGEDIIMYEDINLVGEGNDLSILDFNNSPHGIICAGIGSAEGFRISNIEVKSLQVRNSYKRIPANNSLGGLSFKYVDDFLVEDCKFVNNWDIPNAGGYDLVIDNCTTGLVTRCFSEDGGGFFVQQSSQISTIFNTFENSYLACIYSNGNGGFMNLIMGNNIISSQFYGIVIDDENYIRVIGNTVGSVISVGIFVDSCTKATVTGNVFFDSGSSSVSISLDGSGSCTIGNNTIGANNDIGIHLDNSGYNIINANIVRDIDGSSGILIDADCDRNIVTSNIVSVALTDNGTNTVKANNIT